MTAFDQLRDAAVVIFDKLAVPATITSAGAKTRDKITGTVSMAPGKTKAVRAVLSKRKTKTDDGTIKSEVVAKSNGPAKAGDTLKIGTKTFTVTDIEELSPDGGTPILWTLLLS